MKSRTDFVSIGWMDQLRQAMYNQIKAMGALLWVLLGFTVGLGNMMMEISPFGAALCAAAPFRYLSAAALGSAAGSLLLSNLAELGGAHTLTIKYTAAILLITLARRTAAHSESTMQRTTAAPLLAFFGLLLPSVASLLAQSFSGRNGHHRQAARRRCCQAAHHGHGVDQGNTGLCQKGGSAGRPDRSQCAQL